ncbi:hypothetical protein [Streptomyces griseus]|uniref:hypothetical protein n=1 Tax=Streptomyces griseus TaxID=1911 RepID=UPI000567B523|nr:hypothetical protein [Streptomyces griseus]
MSPSQRWQDMFGTVDDDTRMNLASTDPGVGPGAPGSGNLKHSEGPWSSASGTAGAVRTSTETSRSALGPGHEGVSSGAAGLSALVALTAVRRSWEDRLASVRDECEALQGTLLAVAKEMGETDASVKSSLASIDAKPGEDKR